MPYNKPTIEEKKRGWGKSQIATQMNTQIPIPQFKPVQEKGATIEMTAKFLFITPSINKNTGQPMEGEKDGNKWKQWDVAFNQEGKQQNKIFKVFNDLSGKSLRLNQLVSGTDYKLLYEQGIAQVRANKLFWVGLPLGEPKKPIIPPQQPRGMYVPPVEKESVKTPVNGLQVAPEYQQLWDNSHFDTFEEWMQIAENSNLFNSEEEAKEVHDILSKR